MNQHPIYQPKTAPYEWQAQEFHRFRDAAYAATFAEQRCGKTKAVIDTAAYNYEKGKINSLLVIAAPGRVHRNWVKYEIPDHLPDRIPRKCVVWEAKRIDYDKKARKFKGSLAPELADLLTFNGLAILAVNEGAVLTDSFLRYIPKFLQARQRVMVTLDEFTLIAASPASKTTKKIWKIGRQPQVVIRRILDGTPMESGPLDLYAPFVFLDRSIFGFSTNATFKAHYAQWTTGIRHDKNGNLREYPTQAKDDNGTPLFQNMEEFQRILSKHSFRVLRKDVWDAPPIVYQTYSFELSPIQRAAYDSLRDTYAAELEGSNLSAKHALTRLMRLQQVASNFWPSEKIGAVHEPCNGEGCEVCEDLGVIIIKTPIRRIDPKNNTRLRAAQDVLALNPGKKFIVWARFHEDVDAVMEMCRVAGYSPAQYDGRCSAKQKDAASDDFQAGIRNPLIGNPQSGGRGLKLSRADYMLNYSNSFSLLVRLQLEARAEAKEKTHSTEIIDLVAEDTVDDTLIVPALRMKKSIVDFVMQEKSGKWL